MHEPSYYLPSTHPAGAPDPGAAMLGQSQDPMGPTGPMGPAPGHYQPPGEPPGDQYQPGRPVPGWGPPAPIPPIPRRKSKAGLVVVLLALLAGAGGLGAFLLLDEDDSEKETTETEAASSSSESGETSGTGDDGADGPDTSAERSPEDTLRGWVQALQDRDCEALVDHITKETWLSAGDREKGVANCRTGIEDAAQELDGADLLGVTLVSEDDDHAVVETVTVLPGEVREVTEQADLYLEEGEWRLDPLSFVTVSG